MILNHLYSHIPGTSISSSNPVKVGNKNDKTWQDNVVMVQFDQQEFLPHDAQPDLQPAADESVHPIGQFGWLYYPRRCVYRSAGETGCKMAVILHGCGMTGLDMAQ